MLREYLDVYGSTVPSFHKFSVHLSNGSRVTFTRQLFVFLFVGFQIVNLGFVDEQTHDQVADDLGRLRRKLSALISKVQSEMPKAKGQLPTANCQ